MVYSNIVKKTRIKTNKRRTEFYCSVAYGLLFQLFRNIILHVLRDARDCA